MREPGPGGPRAAGKKEPSAARTSVRRTIKLVAFFVVFYYFALPALAKTNQATHQLGRVYWPYLALGLLLEALSLLAYAQLMRVTLPKCDIGLFRVFRINLATKSLNNLVPGGSAAGSALGYRLLVQSGADGADAGFAIATTGLVSACVLNMILWIALLLSLPFHGINWLYGLAAITGVVILAFAALLGLALMRGIDRAHRVLRAITKHLRFVDPERANDIVEQLAERLREILSDRELVKRGTLWATLNWLLDAAALWVFIYAFGETANVIGVLVAFGLANVLAVVPFTPGGLGIVETVLIPTLVGFGVTKQAAVFAVPVYRIAQFWLPIPLGAIAYLTVRRDLRPVRLRDAAVAAYGEPREAGIEWADRYGHRRPPADYV